MLFVFDLDGVIYRGDEPIKGAIETLEYLRKKGHRIIFASNNATKTRYDYKMKLNRMGFKCNKDEIMCSAYATGIYLNEIGARGKKIYIVGESGLYKELKEFGLKIVKKNFKKECVDYVVAGLNRNFKYKDLETAQQLIFKGAKLIATNKDSTLPTKDKILPGGGSIVAALEVASGVNSFVVIGKPQPYMLKKILQITGYSPKETLVVGDRLETDVLFGKKLNTKTAVVLTGVTTKKDIKRVSKDLKPDYVLKSIADLKKIF